MLRLKDTQRGVLVQAVPAIAHLAAGTLVFGQFIRQQAFSIPLALIGVVFWFAMIGLAMLIAGGKQ